MAKKIAYFGTLWHSFLIWDSRRSHGCVLCEQKDCCSLQRAFDNVHKYNSSILSVPCFSDHPCIFSLWRLFHSHCKHSPWNPGGISRACSFDLDPKTFYHNIRMASFEAQAGLFPPLWMPSLILWVRVCLVNPSFQMNPFSTSITPENIIWISKFIIN